MIRREKGVTLVALVVTIIVLIILASITIGAIRGDDGIINQSKDAKEEVEKQQWEERIDSAIIDAEGKHRNPTLDQVIEELIKDGVIDSKDQVDENGTITTNEPVYEIEGKLDEYLDKEEPEEPENPDEPILGEHIVTYDYRTNGGTSSEGTSMKLKEGEKVDLSVESFKTGYEFVGWNTNKDEHEGLSSLKMGTSNITLYAIYKKEIVATFNSWNGSRTQKEQKIGTIYNNETEVGIIAPKIENTSKNGTNYTARGWGEINRGDAEIVAQSEGSIRIGSNNEYYALYQGSTTTTFYYYNGSKQASVQGNASKTMNASGEEITSEGTGVPSEVIGSLGPYGTNYAGVSTDINSTSPAVIDSSHTVYYAYYGTDIDFYYGNGNSQKGRRVATTNGSGYTTSVTGEPQPESYNNLSFSNWSGDEGSNYEATPSTTTFTEYYAVYSGVKEVRFYYYNYSQTSTTATGTAGYVSTKNGIASTGGTVTVPTEVRNSSGPNGTSYLGVSTSTNSSEGTNSTTVSLDNSNYYAYYSTQITYYYGSGYSRKTTRRSVSDGINYVTTVDENYRPVNYDSATFKCWSTTSNYETAVEPNETSKTVLYAVYEREVEVTFNYYSYGIMRTTASGTRTYISNSSGITKNEGSVDIPDEVKSSKGKLGMSYAFVSTSMQNTSPVIPTTEAPTTYYAIYSREITVTLMTYYNMADTSTKTTVYEFSNGSSIATGVTLGRAPNTSGFTFKGWAETSSPTASTISYTQYLTDDVTYYALYERSYVISYDLNGGTGNISSQQYTVTRNYLGQEGKGNPITIASGATKSGYGFVYWNTNSSGTGTVYKPGESITTDQDMCLYAIWYKITVPRSISSKQGEVVKMVASFEDINDVTSYKLYKASSATGKGTEVNFDSRIYSNMNSSTIIITITQFKSSDVGYYYLGITTNTYGNTIEIESPRTKIKFVQ